MGGGYGARPPWKIGGSPPPWKTRGMSPPWKNQYPIGYKNYCSRR